MQRYAILLLSAGLVTGLGAYAAGPLIEIRAQPPALEVVQHATGRQQLEPPSLTFPIDVKAECPTGGHLESVTLSIADTRQTYRPAQSESATTFTASLTVSERQLAPVVIDRFCAENSEDYGSKLVVGSLASVHVSLRCGGPTGASAHYHSQPLAVELVCTKNGREEAAPGFVSGLPW